MPTKAEREYMGRVAALGCCVCRKLGYGATPAEVHHIRTGMGRKRASHYETIPLCPIHHRTGGKGTAYHEGAKVWQERFGLEVEFLEETKRMLGKPFLIRIGAGNA